MALLDAGIAATFKAYFRRELVRWTLNQLETPAEHAQVDVCIAIVWAAGAWSDMMSMTILNCRKKTGSLPNSAESSCPELQIALADLRESLVLLSRSTEGPLCRITDFDIAGEHISENLYTDAERVEEEAAEL